MNAHPSGSGAGTSGPSMEAPAPVRRTLANACLAAGWIGAASGMVHRWLTLESATAFAAWWLATALVCAGVSLGLARQEAKGAGATREAMGRALPSCAAGLLVSVPFLLGEDWARRVVWLLPALWMVLYGCGLHAAGHGRLREVGWMGWAYVLGGSGLLLWWTCPLNQFPPVSDAHVAMGVGFGVVQAGYGAYLRMRG